MGRPIACFCPRCCAPHKGAALVGAVGGGGGNAQSLDGVIILHPEEFIYLMDVLITKDTAADPQEAVKGGGDVLGVSWSS